RKRPRQSSVRPARSSSRVSTAVSPSNCLNASINAITSLRDGPALAQTASAQVVIAIRLLQSYYANYEFGMTGSQAGGCPALRKTRAACLGVVLAAPVPNDQSSPNDCLWLWVPASPGRHRGWQTACDTTQKKKAGIAPGPSSL